MTPQLLTAKQCAESLSIGISTWWQWVREGKALKKHQISPNIVVWRSDEVQDFINQIAPRS